jgi:hypothetical protein
MENMGRQKLVDKTVMPQETGIMPQQLAGFTVAEALRQRLGAFVLGGYKGQSAFLDLDKLVNQPLARVEGLYSLDRLDARDIITASIPATAVIGDIITAQLAVPAGELWLVNRVVVVSPAQTGAEGQIVTVNFRLSAWQIPDTRIGTTVHDNGRSYWPAAQGSVAANTYTVDCPAQGELGEELRLAGGSVITLVATLTAANASAILAATLTPFGRKIRRLVA